MNRFTALVNFFELESPTPHRDGLPIERIGDVVRGLQVARDGVGVPDHVLVADLTRVLHVLLSAVKRSIGSTTGFHNHGEGPY